MASITFYPLGNADCYRLDVAGGQKILFDYADMRCADDPGDKRADLPTELRRDLTDASRDYFDVVAFTHFDDDHVCGASAFFELEHAEKYQGKGRIKIREMWVPAWAITESSNDLCEDGKILQAEAQYRLKKGARIRVFSRPEALKTWLERQGLTLESRKGLITDAGQLVPGWTKGEQGIEFFVHSPFASRQDDGTLVDRNSNSLVFQAVFSVRGVETKTLLMADTVYECLEEIVQITKQHGREDRLEWDLAKLPHHCSYKALGPDKGQDRTDPTEEIAWLYEEQHALAARIISTSDPIPSSGDQDQPPHRQAANYYRSVVERGDFYVTMEYPTTDAPTRLVAKIDEFKVTVAKAAAAVGAGITGRPALRAGSRQH